MQGSAATEEKKEQPATSTTDSSLPMNEITTTRTQTSPNSSATNRNEVPSRPVASPSRRRKKQYAVSTQWERQAEARDCHSYFCCCATRLGHMHVLCSHPDGSPILMAGPCWPFCMFVTVPMILGISALVVYFLILDDSFANLPWWLVVIYVPAVCVVLLLLFCVSCRDPGLMERVTDEEAGQGGWFWNEQVGSYRPPGALYCRECGVLIQEYDHLCPWTGTGIGKSNMWAFKSFVVSVNLLCYLSIGILIWALLQGLAS